MIEFEVELVMLNRAWLMRGFMEDKLKNNIETALEFYTSALDVLQWGKELWKDVSFDDKGAVFRETFMRGIKCRRLEALIGVRRSFCTYLI